ncbi:MAG: ubiquinol-cytochrome c reductase iron-sulfur subunit [Candidatus Cyclobacteriaceae bacterium M3_2C_046]
MSKKLRRRALLKKYIKLIPLSCMKWNIIFNDYSVNCCYTPPLDPACFKLNGQELVINLNKSGSLQNPGQAASFKHENLPVDIIIIHLELGKFAVLSRSCTHAGREVNFVKERNLVQCHNFSHSTFSTRGEVIKGPASQPLKNYNTQLRDQQLTIFLS